MANEQWRNRIVGYADVPPDQLVRSDQSRLNGNRPAFGGFMTRHAQRDEVGKVVRRFVVDARLSCANYTRLAVIQ